MTSLAPHPLSLRQLQYVVAIADLASFRRAAERCRVAQPSLSAQIAAAEDALGVRLFERDSHGVRLTAAGEVLVVRARRVLREADDLVDAARRLQDPLAGTLRVGVIPTVAPYLLPEIVPALHKAFPRLTLAWVEDKTEVLLRRVDEGSLDAALLAVVPELGALEQRVVRVDPFVLAMPRGHRLAKGRGPVDAGALAGEHVLLLDDGHCFRTQALAVCTAARAEEDELRATSLPTLAQMVSTGVGVTLLPRMSVETEARRANLVTRALQDPAPSRVIVLAWRKTSAVTVALGEVGAVIASSADTRTPRAAASRRPS